MHLVHTVAMLAVLQFFVFSALAGRARAKSDLVAPAMLGDEQFERAFRVQMNTLEQLVCFLPSLLIAANYWPDIALAAIGVVYLVGRILYRSAYVSDPAKRGPGFLLSIVPTFILMIAALVGALIG